VKERESERKKRSKERKIGGDSRKDRQRRVKKKNFEGPSKGKRGMRPGKALYEVHREIGNGEGKKGQAVYKYPPTNPRSR